MLRMRLSGGQRNTLIRFLTNAGTIALGGLVVGPFIGPHPFRPGVLMVGVLLYLVVFGLALWFSQERMGED